MSGVRLVPKRVEKVWGRRDLAPWFDSVPAESEPVGEIWFELPGDGPQPELLVKFLFTSERLSVQVHPDDEAAHARGLSQGKSEAWYVLAAEPHATIGLGMREVVSPDTLRDAALDGSIVGMMRWEAVKPGDCFFAPAGTVHAIGAGIKLIEVQQNSDITYRLYDYGRPRELHLEDGIAVADPRPWVASTIPRDIAAGRRLLVGGPAFVMERWHIRGSGTLMPAEERPCFVVVLSGGGVIGGEPATAGETWLLDTRQTLRFDDGTELLVAYPGDKVIDDLWRPDGSPGHERHAERSAAYAGAKGQEFT